MFQRTKRTKRIRSRRLFVAILLLIGVFVLRRPLAASSDSKQDTRRNPAFRKDALGDLPVWEGLKADKTMKSFGTETPTGAFSYRDAPQCQKSNSCILYFPLEDLANIILIDELKKPIKETKPKTARDILSSVYYLKPTLVSNHSDYGHDLALLTRRGFKGSPQVNQDRIIFLDQNNGMKVMALFDGHGQLGHVVSHACALAVAKHFGRIHKSITKHSAEKILTKAILQLDQSLPAAEASGSTGLIIVQQESQLYVANVGDSLAFVAEFNPDMAGGVAIIYQTKPHKPDLPQERQRIERAGGRVYMPETPGESSRVLIQIGAVELGLAMSRTLGDIEGKERGFLTARPTVDVVDLKDGDRQRFAVVATDGLFDYVAPVDVARHLGQVLFRKHGLGVGKKKRRLVDACEQLIQRAAQRWQETSMSTYRDDISIAVMRL